MRGKCPYYCSFAFFYFIKPSWLRCQANSEGIKLVMLLVNLSEMWLIWNGAEPSFKINNQLFIALKQAKCVQSNCNCIMQSMPISTKWILPIWYHNRNTRFLLIFQRCGWYEMVQNLLSKLIINSSSHLSKLNVCSRIAIVLCSLCPSQPNEFCQFGIIIKTLAIYVWLVSVQVPIDLMKYNPLFPPSMTWTSSRNIDYRF